MPPKKIVQAKTKIQRDETDDVKLTAATKKAAEKVTAKASPAKPVKTVTDKKTPEVASKKNSKKSKEEETDDTEPAAPKKLRREGSDGGSGKFFDSKALVNISQEEVEKDTQLFDYAENAKAVNSKKFPPGEYLKIISWNVAGIRALVKNGFKGSELEKLIKEEAPDVLCLQETKLSETHDETPLADTVIPQYTFVESISTVKKGYAGTRTYLKDGVFDPSLSLHALSFQIPTAPAANKNSSSNISTNSFGNRILSKNDCDSEGRVVTSYLVPQGKGSSSPLLLVNSYVPNSGMQLERLDFRVGTYDAMVRQFLTKDVLQLPLYAAAGSSASPTPVVIWTGDLNVAERNYDRFHNGNFKGMQKVPGFTPAERASFRQTLEAANLVDSFRSQYPNHRGAYTFFSKMFNQRAKGNGWRLDYFAVSAAAVAAGKVAGNAILNAYKSSDHLPLVIFLKK